MQFNGSIVNEREALATCFGRLYLGSGQVVRSMTRSVAQMAGDEERLVSYLRESLSLSEETLDDFVAKNREQHPVEPDLNPGGRLIYVDDGEFGRIFCDADGWNRFCQMFPKSDGTLRFSRVGLNRSVTQAVLYAGQQFDWGIGSGGYWLLTKSDGEWQKAGRAGTWIS